MVDSQSKPEHERERGFLLIADMENSTGSKFRLGEAGAFEALREHNRLVMDHCRKAEPVAGRVLNSLGDAVVAKFPLGDDDDSSAAALGSCLRAARSIVSAFESLEPLAAPDGEPFPLRTKLTLQFYDAFRYGRHQERGGLAEELVGPEIDAAFRISAVSWRLQVLASERFVVELLRHSQTPEGAGHDQDPSGLLCEARLARERGAALPDPLSGIAIALKNRSPNGDLAYWVTDAREIARLKGLPGNQRVFLLAFEDPALLAARDQRPRLCIKVRQDHHAVILASVSLERGRNDDYIDYVLSRLDGSSEAGRLESELTLCAAAKIYGEFDFFFRVSCIDDESLRRFFATIHDPNFGVQSVEVRSTVGERFYVNPRYDRVLGHFRSRGFDLVLTWFERDPGSDLFERFASYIEAGRDGPVRPVELLETGEVIHHKPVYGLFLCDDLAAYARFFEEAKLNPTGCRSHIGQISSPGDARLRYSLMSGVYAPRRD